MYAALFVFISVMIILLYAAGMLLYYALSRDGWFKDVDLDVIEGDFERITDDD